MRGRASTGHKILATYLLLRRENRLHVVDYKDLSGQKFSGSNINP
jgi:hypothetical protein